MRTEFWSVNLKIGYHMGYPGVNKIIIIIIIIIIWVAKKMVWGLKWFET
jgi:hypothetical protein